MSFTTLDMWIEWKRCCAADACGDETRAALRGFGAIAFAKSAAQLDPSTPVDAKEGWHLFESYMHATSGRTGKRWKDWLFDKAANTRDNPRDVLEAETWDCMFSETRKYLTQVGALRPRRHGYVVVSKDAAVRPGDPDSGTNEDLGVMVEEIGPTTLSAFRDLCQHIEEDVGRCFGDCDYRMRVVLVAEGLDIARTHPVITTAAGCKKSVLYRVSFSINEVIEKVAFARVPDDAAVAGAYATLLMEKLREVAITWGRKEKALREIF